MVRGSQADVLEALPMAAGFRLDIVGLWIAGPLVAFR